MDYHFRADSHFGRLNNARRISQQAIHPASSVFVPPSACLISSTWSHNNVLYLKQYSALFKERSDSVATNFNYKKTLWWKEKDLSRPRQEREKMRKHNYQLLNLRCCTTEDNGKLSARQQQQRKELITKSFNFPVLFINSKEPFSRFVLILDGRQITILDVREKKIQRIAVKLAVAT